MNVSTVLTIFTALSTTTIFSLFVAHTADRSLFAIVDYESFAGTALSRGEQEITVENVENLRLEELIGTMSVPCGGIVSDDNVAEHDSTHRLSQCDTMPDCSAKEDEPDACELCRAGDADCGSMVATADDETNHFAGEHDATIVVPLKDKKDVTEGDYWMHCDDLNAGSVAFTKATNGQGSQFTAELQGDKKPKGGWAVSMGLHCDGVNHCAAKDDEVAKDETDCKTFTCTNKHTGLPIEFLYNDKYAFFSTAALCKSVGQYSTDLYGDSMPDFATDNEVKHTWMFGGGSTAYVYHKDNKVQTFGIGGKAHNEVEKASDQLTGVAHDDTERCGTWTAGDASDPVKDFGEFKGAKGAALADAHTFHPCCFQTADALKNPLVEAGYTKHGAKCARLFEGVTTATTDKTALAEFDDFKIIADRKCNILRHASGYTADNLIKDCNDGLFIAVLPHNNKVCNTALKDKQSLGNQFMFDVDVLGGAGTVGAITEKGDDIMPKKLDGPKSEQYLYLNKPMMFTAKDVSPEIAEHLCKEYLTGTVTDQMRNAAVLRGGLVPMPKKKSRSRRAGDDDKDDDKKTETKPIIWGKRECGRDNYKVIENADEFDTVILTGISFNLFITVIYFMHHFDTTGTTTESQTGSTVIVLHIIKAGILLAIGGVLAAKAAELYSLDFSNECFMDQTEASVGSLGAVFASSAALALTGFFALVFSGLHQTGQFLGFGFTGSKWQSVSTSILG